MHIIGIKDKQQQQYTNKNFCLGHNTYELAPT